MTGLTLDQLLPRMVKALREGKEVTFTREGRTFKILNIQQCLDFFLEKKKEMHLLFERHAEEINKAAEQYAANFGRSPDYAKQLLMRSIAPTMRFEDFNEVVTSFRGALSEASVCLPEHACLVKKPNRKARRKVEFAR